MQSLHEVKISQRSEWEDKTIVRKDNETVWLM